MLLYETVLKRFCTADQIMNADELQINEVIASYKKELELFDDQYIKELKEFCGKTKKKNNFTSN